MQTSDKRTVLSSSLFLLNIVIISIFLLSYYGIIASSWMDVLFLNPIISFIAFLFIQIQFKNKTPLLKFFQTVNMLLFFVPIFMFFYAIYTFLTY